MDDVIAVALITGGFTGTASVLTALVTGKATRHAAEKQAQATEKQADVTIKTVEQSASVELAKVQAEADRLRQQYAEDSRRHRQGSYHDFLAVINRFTSTADTRPWDPQAIDEVLREFYYYFSGVHLFGSDEVRGAANQFNDIMAEISHEAGAGDRATPFQQRLMEAYEARRQAFVDAEVELMERMREDVARHLYEE